MKNLALVAVVLLAASCRTTDVKPPRTHVPENATTLRPPGPGPANLSFSCTGTKVGCDPAGYSMALLGDVATCEVMGPGSLRLELRSSNDTNDLIVIAFEGYTGPGSYTLNDPARNFININDNVDWNGCDGPTTVAKRVTAGDPNCASPACTLQVRDDTPDAGFPRPLTFAVHCDSLCENGSDLVCQGPFDFMTRVTCG